MKINKFGFLSILTLIGVAGSVGDVQAIPVPDNASTCAAGSNANCFRITTNVVNGTAVSGVANASGSRGVFGSAPSTGWAGFFDGKTLARSLSVGPGTWVANIGVHPSYPNFAGFWLSGLCSNCTVSDYSLLTDGQSTFLNAPQSNGALWFRAANADRAFLSANLFEIFVAEAQKPGGGEWTAPSDIRIKKEVVEFHHGLDDLVRIRPVSYKYNGLAGTRDDDVRYVGVIAQDLEKVLPFMVSSQKKKLHSDDQEPTDIKQVDPSAFTYVLINAVKELAAENRQMKKLLCQDHPRERVCNATVAAR